MLNFDQVHKAALGRRMGPFRARVEKLGPDNLHLAPTNTNQAANQVDLKLDDEGGSPLDMDQSLWFFFNFFLQNHIKRFEVKIVNLQRYQGRWSTYMYIVNLQLEYSING